MALDTVLGKIARWCVRAAAITIVALILLFIGLNTSISTTLLYHERASILDALKNAQSVDLDHYDHKRGDLNADGTGIIYTIAIGHKELGPADFDKVAAAFPLRLAFLSFMSPNCFVPHHWITINEKDGTKFKIPVCFTCGMIKVADREEHNLPWGWTSSVRRLFDNAGALHNKGLQSPGSPGDDPYRE